MPLSFRLFFLCAAASMSAAAQAPKESMDWFQGARFGMFIHWSIASAEGLEGSWPIMMPGALPKLGNVTDAQYRAFAQRFNPTAYKPDDWVRLAKAAGQRYMVFTSKHHDGFAMFDSKYTNYKVTKSPYGKDVMAELSAACSRAGMPLGLYYSPPDLDHPGYRDMKKPAKDTYYGEPYRPEWPLYLDYMELQIEELLTRYGKVPILWFDGFKETPWSPARFEAVIRRLQPKTLINNRLGSLADFDISENVFPRRIPTKTKPIVQGTPSRIVRADISDVVPTLAEFRPWEMCVPMNETWTYNPMDHQFKSTADLIRTLVEVASRGGNFLLNVGPKADGTIQAEVEERLLGIGDWLKRNGESIYGTTYGPIQAQAPVRTTAKGNRIYLHVFEWPVDGKLTIANLPGVIRSAAVLSTGAAVKVTRSAAGAVFQLPQQAPDSPVTVVQVTLASPWIPGPNPKK
jgi:alpha-L-fucosidase